MNEQSRMEFEAFVRTLPAPQQQTILEAAERGESTTYAAWQAARASAEPSPFAVTQGEIAWAQANPDYAGAEIIRDRLKHHGMQPSERVSVPYTLPAEWRDAFELAAQMLTWGEDEGLTASQEREVRAHRAKMFAMLAAAPKVQEGEPEPVPMLLFCPQCRVQHIDGEEVYAVPCLVGLDGLGERDVVGWPNPPHRTHLCHACGHTWRPADVATTGVAELKTCGQNDGSPVPIAPAKECLTVGDKPYAWAYTNLHNETNVVIGPRFTVPEGFVVRALYLAPPATTEEPSAVERPCDFWLAEYPASGRTYLYDGEPTKYQVTVAGGSRGVVVRLWRHPPDAHPDARDAGRIDAIAAMVAKPLPPEEALHLVRYTQIEYAQQTNYRAAQWRLSYDGHAYSGDTLRDAIDRAMGAAKADEAIRHGVNCPKAAHDGRGGYLHAEFDDAPYVDDGVTYCGRCHHFISPDMGAKDGQP